MTENTLGDLVKSVVAVDGVAAEQARQRHTGLAKPPGSLGWLEELGARLAGISGRCPPPVPSAPAVVVAAADHGVHAQGISDWPQSVTEAMLATIASGGAAVNAIAGSVGAEVTIVDVGTARTGPVPDGVHDERVRAGTRDLTVEAAMTVDECAAAVETGARVASARLDAGADVLVTGEVGIANTTATACLLSAFADVDPETVTGKGANTDHTRTPRKVEVVRTALARHGDERDPLRTLASLGGLEHAAMVGVALAGAAGRVPVIVDGVVAGAAAVAAVALCPDVAGYLIPGHSSAEPGGHTLARRLGHPALVDLDLRLGEGTGALLAVPTVTAAAAVLARMATLDSVLG
ncbi:nicotinate-nucleotide-dimethylbenzimidazole phosphoribosyltransferase [Haloactinopolyspora alba]|uniref:Nicotinate-nucleotide--dimethylbenzimidazole phosphoribosyltransferase n=1 Tax=Haloactinopolyspora alba TaxID=648780 RepID=A0A2P8E6V3_9ACTN|nr:nicotinate-nucleotide--dimethylbenzimidazole phosphoribosyltransferase [Haloactinopolyspora alba]PSL05157.1 nicotinate-nucleotide-dimethylbenzimidazole phosphoribosyltransferase [Haloactinopolyspora alba]